MLAVLWALAYLGVEGQRVLASGVEAIVCQHS